MLNSNFIKYACGANIRVTSLVLCLIATSLSSTCAAFAQASDYKPGGAPIVFKDYSSKGTTSAASSGATSAVDANSTSPSTSTSSPVPTSEEGEANSKGLGSLFRGVKQELQNAGGYARQNGYRNNQNGSVYQQSAPSYSNWVPSNTYRPDAVQPSNFGAGNAQRNDPSYMQNSGYTPRHAHGGNYGGSQNAPQISGNLMDVVTNNPPSNIGGDLENLIPAELHKKAYGIELHRNGPLNGAEDNTHIY